ncbi:protein kinase [Frankia sp. R82]|uniref:protein kinase domain-containing protein n=1 Tax=Frankia sp. R82 TaxID=2950553 RepID=UPI002044ABD4|nr:protein kinase [Frankia sp. R82]MCM3886791.1 protein kinase [Frankia sp. R82]
MMLQEYVQAALPDYDVGRELGRGGFGRVFAARHRRLDRAVAVKVLPLAADDADGEPADTGTVSVLFGEHRSVAAGSAGRVASRFGAAEPGPAGSGAARFGTAGFSTAGFSTAEFGAAAAGLGAAGLVAGGLAAGKVDAEAHIVASLDHPHIVRVFDYVRTPETALIVMELLPGGTLAERARDGLTAPGACAVAAAIAVALDRVHREGLLHCDIKPSNILFTADGAPRLTDFGIARLLETTVGITQTSVVGSTPYLAPEQFELAAPGTGVDVYSLGAVLYELLAGTPPFGADPRPHVMAERHRSAAPPALPAHFGGLDAVTRRALAKDPADRQPGALVFAIELCAAAERTFGPDWLAHTGIRFRGEDDLRRPDPSPWTSQLPPPGPPGRSAMSSGAPATPSSRSARPARRPAGLQGRSAGMPTPGMPTPGWLGQARRGGLAVGPGRWWTAPVGVSVATTVVVVATVLALLATGVLSIGRPGTTAVAESGSGAAPPIVYPVSAPLPLRGLISLAADPAGGILLTDSSQHTLTRFADGKVTSIIGRPASVATASTGPGTGGTSTPTGTSASGGLERPERIGLPGVARDEPAADAGLHRPAGLGAGGGSVFVADEWNCVVRRLYQPLGQPWRAETVAGRPAAEPTGTGIGAGTGADGGDPNTGRPPEQICPAGGASSAPRALGARVGTPTSVAVGGDGAVYFTTGYAGQVWRLDPAGASGDYRSTPATLVAGRGSGSGSEDRRGAEERRYDGTESATAVGLDNAYAVAVDGAGRVFVLSYAGGYARIHLIENGMITTVVQRRLDESALTTLAPAPGGRGVLFTDADTRTISLLDPPAAAASSGAGATAGSGATRTVVRGTCVGATERLFGVAADRAGDLYYSCNDATQAAVYRLTAGDLAAGVAGPGRRVLY